MALRRDVDRTLPARAVLATRTTLNGLLYSTASSHVGNSNVLVKAAVREPEEPCAAKIAYVLRFEKQTVIIVRYHLPTTSPARDLFSRYPVLRTSVWNPEVSDRLSAVTVEQIVCHFAELHATWAEQKIMIAVSLSRVSYYH